MGRGPRARTSASAGLSAVLLGALLLTACGSQGQGGPGGTGVHPVLPVSGPSGSWRLVTGRTSEGPLGPAGLLRARPVTLEVRGHDASGVSSCNHYGTTVKVSGHDVSFGMLAATEMGCPPRVMELERRYLLALGTVDSFTATRDRLVLHGPSVVLRFRRGAAAPR